MFLKTDKTAQGAKTHHGNKASGNETQEDLCFITFFVVV